MPVNSQNIQELNSILAGKSQLWRNDDFLKGETLIKE